MASDTAWNPEPGERIVALHFAGNRLVGREVIAPTDPGRARPRALSARCRQVLPYMAEGLTNAEIARQLFVTPETVKKHVATIYRELGALNRAHAVAIAWRRNLLGR